MKKDNKSLLNNKTFYLADDDGNEIDFKGETLTFALLITQM